METYCELDFLIAFFEKFPDGSAVEGILKEEAYSAYWNFSKILFTDLEICIDNKDRVSELAVQNPFFKKLMKSDTGGGSRLIDFSSEFAHLEDEEYVGKLNPSSTHLYSSTKNYRASNFQLGYLTAVPEWNSLMRVLKLNREFRIEIGRTSPPDFNHWGFLSEYSNWVNAAVIVDPYLLESPAGFEQNLYKIIRSILPEKLDTIFHLTLVARPEDISRGNVMYTLIQEFLCQLQLSYEVKFGLYLSTRREEHDREILTNYYRVHSGHSIDYFDTEGLGKRSTTVRFTGLLGVENNAHFQILESIQQLVAKAKTGFDHFGVQGNRLFR